jgi:hypothetical protein
VSAFEFVQNFLFVTLSPLGLLQIKLNWRNTYNFDNKLRTMKGICYVIERFLVLFPNNVSVFYNIWKLKPLASHFNRLICPQRKSCLYYSIRLVKILILVLFN